MVLARIQKSSKLAIVNRTYKRKGWEGLSELVGKENRLKEYQFQRLSTRSTEFIY